MATKKKSTRRSGLGKPATGRGKPESKSSSRATVGGPARQVPYDTARTEPMDLLMQKAAGQQALATAIPFNAAKAGEHGRAAYEPPSGQAVEPDDPMVGGSTLSETNASPKVGAGAPAPGFNPTVGPLDRVRVDSATQTLTTNQGVPVSDNQNSLKAGLRGPALLEDFVLREKVTHFDHERIPERVVHARGSGAHGYFECYE
jgi:catalase